MTGYNRNAAHARNSLSPTRIGAAFVSVALALVTAFAMLGIPHAWAKNDSGHGNGNSAEISSIIQSMHQRQATEGSTNQNHVTAPAASMPAPEASATVLVYMNGSDLESDGGAATNDITEMLDSGIGANANVIIETLGTRKWQNYGIASDHTQRYAVKQGSLELVDDSLGQLDTTSPDTLSDFISWGVANYPAQRYFLLFWDHGAGPVYGFGYDEFQSDYAALTLDEMQQALEANSNVHFDAIGMDCCIMSSLETCHVFAPYCDYIILSEDFEPGVGWSYKGWMSELEANPTISTAELGSIIVDDMIKDVAADEENGDATLALIDEKAVPALYSAWVNFAYANEEELLNSNYSQEMEWHGWSRIPGSHGEGSNVPGGQGRDGYGAGENAYGWDGSYGSGYYGYGPDMMDGYGPSAGALEESYGWDDPYGWFDIWGEDESYVTMTDYYVTDILEVASSIDSSESSALQSAVNDAIAHYGRTAGETRLSGIGVTLPYGDAEFYDELVDVFTACGIDGEYVSWLEGFVNASGSDNYFDFGSRSEGPGYAVDEPSGSYGSHGTYDARDYYGFGNSDGRTGADNPYGSSESCGTCDEYGSGRGAYDDSHAEGNYGGGLGSAHSLYGSSAYGREVYAAA